jgi:hypothetical protein
MEQHFTILTNVFFFGAKFCTVATHKNYSHENCTQGSFLI